MEYSKQKILFIFISLSLASPVFAGDAVSQTNGKIETLFGNVDGKRANLLAGSLSAPLSSKFGIQGDALTGKINSKTSNGLGLHLFWRDSDIGLLGLTTSRVKYNSNKLKRTSLEGEYYFKKVTISGELGRQTGDIKKSNYNRLNLSYYPVNNLALSIGNSHTNISNKNNIDIEYQTKINGLSLFANFAKGNNNYDHAIGGIRYYFGKQKSLIERHRNDDPRNLLFAGAAELAGSTTANTTTNNGTPATGGTNPPIPQ